MDRIPSVFSGTNSQLIKCIASLYLDGKTILDVTYGRGKWWKDYREPDGKFVGDYTSFVEMYLNIPVKEYNVVTYDPAYVSTSKSSKTSIHDMNNRYGLDKAPAGVLNVFDDMMIGFHNSLLFCVEDGLVLQKCQQQVESGVLWDVPRMLKNEIEKSYDVCLWDEIIHVRGLGPQPLFNRDGSERVWQRTHRACSHLLIWKKG